jgi:hypothetical protein
MIIFTDYILPKNLLPFIGVGSPMTMGLITSDDVVNIVARVATLGIPVEIQVMNISIGKWIQKRFIHKPVTCSMEYDVSPTDAIIMVVPQHKVSFREPAVNLDAMEQNDEIRYIYLCQQEFTATTALIPSTDTTEERVENLYPAWYCGKRVIPGIDTTEERIETLFDEPAYDQNTEMNTSL